MGGAVRDESAPTESADARSTFRVYAASRRADLRRTAYLLCGDWYLADDLVQDALVKLSVHWRRVSARDEVDAYVRRMLVNGFLATRRPWRREIASAELPDRPDPVAQPPDATGPLGSPPEDDRRRTTRPAEPSSPGASRSARRSTRRPRRCRPEPASATCPWTSAGAASGSWTCRS